MSSFLSDNPNVARILSPGKETAFCSTKGWGKKMLLLSLSHLVGPLVVPARNLYFTFMREEKWLLRVKRKIHSFIFSRATSIMSINLILPRKKSNGISKWFTSFFQDAAAAFLARFCKASFKAKAASKQLSNPFLPSHHPILSLSNAMLSPVGP